MLKVRSMSASGTLPVCWSHLKIGGNLPRGSDRSRVRAGGKHARQVIRYPSAGDVSHAFDEATADPGRSGADDVEVRAMRDEERLADRAAERGNHAHRRRARADSNAIRRASE